MEELCELLALEAEALARDIRMHGTNSITVHDHVKRVDCLYHEIFAMKPNQAGDAIVNTMQDFIEQNTAYKWAKALEQAYGREGTE